jgi:hypothetical protein
MRKEMTIVAVAALRFSAARQTPSQTSNVSGSPPGLQNASTRPLGFVSFRSRNSKFFFKFLTRTPT